MRPARDPISSRPNALCIPEQRSKNLAPSPLFVGSRRDKTDRGQRSASCSEPPRIAHLILAHKGSALVWLVDNRGAVRGRFYRLTDCHPLEEDAGMACFSSSRKHLAGVPGLTSRVEGERHFQPLVFWDYKKRRKKRSSFVVRISAVRDTVLYPGSMNFVSCCFISLKAHIAVINGTTQMVRAAITPPPPPNLMLTRPNKSVPR